MTDWNISSPPWPPDAAPGAGHRHHDSTAADMGTIGGLGRPRVRSTPHIRTHRRRPAPRSQFAHQVFVDDQSEHLVLVVLGDCLAQVPDGHVGYLQHVHL